MPVILKPEQFDGWLGSMGVDDINLPIDDDYLARRRVSRREITHALRTTMRR